MLEVIIGFIILIMPYLLGCILNILAYNFDFKQWEGIGVTYTAGLIILAALYSAVFILYHTGYFILWIIN